VYNVHIYQQLTAKSRIQQLENSVNRLQQNIRRYRLNINQEEKN
jgi:Na+/phosphate symporter